jgi:hypothetical protein
MGAFITSWTRMDAETILMMLTREQIVFLLVKAHGRRNLHEDDKSNSTTNHFFSMMIDSFCQCIFPIIEIRNSKGHFLTNH